MLKPLLSVLLVLVFMTGSAQDTTRTNKNRQRLDFAKTYFETGGSYLPAFRGKRMEQGTIRSLDHSTALNQYLTWGAFHFWGHAEFFVNFPMGQLLPQGKVNRSYKLDQSVVTGGRLYPWAMQDGKIRPFVGVNWGALDFKQTADTEQNSPTLAKDFLLNMETGLLYNYKNFGLRLGVNYNADHKWQYPLDKLHKAEIKTPAFTASLGLLYAFDLSKDAKAEDVDKWNNYPTLSKLSSNASRKGDFFIGAGPSISFSLDRSAYLQDKLPYLKDRLASKNYVDIAIGYHLNQANLFTALSFRNPKYRTSGYGDELTIKKSALALEINKFLLDYTGFAPYLGVNLSYDRVRYSETVVGQSYQVTHSDRWEPGITVGWDIVPGKTDEALILRTNLRWYPRSRFEVKGNNFNFKQLEYNLIQVVFYPGRLKRK